VTVFSTKHLMALMDPQISTLDFTTTFVLLSCSFPCQNQLKHPSKNIRVLAN
jgi:hypothetical protein